MSSSTITPLSISGILGTDDVAPVYNPANTWKTWNITEIYTGSVGLGKFVPNLNDYAVDTTTDDYYKVTAINPTTMVATLTAITTVPSAAFNSTDILLGVGPGTQSDTYRLYVDNSVIPNVLAVDARLHVAGSMATSCKIFLGSDLSNTGTVISSVYNQSGNLISQSIPLELVAAAGLENISIKTVPVCYTTQQLADGEVVVAVFYSDNGNVVSKRQLLVENTAFIRTTDSSLKYISGIALQCPFLSTSDPNLIQYPMNVPLNGLSLMGVVNYSDGSSLVLPVDGTKFSIFGFRDYVATVVGQKLPLVLKYTLSPGEIVYGATAGSINNVRFVTEAYQAVTINEDGIYTVKLFCYPVWNSITNSYSLEWYLYNLERNTVFNVSPYVTITPTSEPFNPTGYGITQNLEVSINLSSVNPIYTSYVNVQTVTVTLAAAGTGRAAANWTIGYSPGQTPPFGVGNHAVTTYVGAQLTTVAIDVGAANLTEWLNRLYYATEPLTDPFTETAPPVPNMFSISYNGLDFEYTIDQWNVPLHIGTGIVNNDTLLVKFFLRTTANDLQLAIAGLQAWQTN